MLPRQSLLRRVRDGPGGLLVSEHIGLARSIVNCVERKNAALAAAFANMRRGEYDALLIEIDALLAKGVAAPGPSWDGVLAGLGPVTAPAQELARSAAGETRPRSGSAPTWGSNRSYVLRALEIAEQPMRLSDVVAAVASARDLPIEGVRYYSISSALRSGLQQKLIARGPVQRERIGPFGYLAYHRYRITAAGRELVAKLRAARANEAT